jgi:hypothetical protein
MIHLSRLIIFMIGFYSCTSSGAEASPSDPKKWFIEDIPEIGLESTIYLGDKMMLQRSGRYLNCLRSGKLFERDYIGWIRRIEQDGLLCASDIASEEDFYPYGFNSIVSSKTGKPMPPVSGFGDWHFNFEEKRGRIWIRHVPSRTVVEKISPEEFEQFFVPEKRYQISSEYNQRTIEYLGRNGRLLKFLYSEFRDNAARVAFTREFQLDLNEGSIGAFKGAVFEVIEATNSVITYKVVRNFEH